MKTSEGVKNNGGLKSAAKISVVPMIAATYFMVAGGPYGLEDIVTGHGYFRAILLLLAVPVVWSLPVALMVGERHKLGDGTPKPSASGQEG